MSASNPTLTKAREAIEKTFRYLADFAEDLPYDIENAIKRANMDLGGISDVEDLAKYLKQYGRVHRNKCPIWILTAQTPTTAEIRDTCDAFIIFATVVVVMNYALHMRVYGTNPDETMAQNREKVMRSAVVFLTRVPRKRMQQIVKDYFDVER